MEVLTKISIDSLFSTLTTLFVFITGFLLNKVYDEWKESKDFATTYRFFVHTINSNIEGIKKQANALNKLSKKLNDISIHDFKFQTVTSINFEEYEKIDRVNLFKHLRYKMLRSW